MGGKSTSTSAAKLNQLSVQSSSYGLPISLGWGRNRIKCNVIWYNAFKATPHTTKTAGKGLGGGSKNTTYTYSASIILGLCEGTIQGARTIYKDQAVYTNGATTALAQAGFSLATGGVGQAVWGYLTSFYPAEALNYSGIAYVYAQDYALSDSATLPNHSFEVDFGVQMSGLADADPKDILTDFLTNSNYGLPGWSSGLLGDLSDWSLYCRANNLLLSPVMESQVRASDFISNDLLMATNSDAYWSEGVLKVRPYGDAAATGNSVTWTPNLTPIYDLTENDLIPDGDGQPVTLEIVDQSDAYNIVQVEYLDRANQYNAAIMPAPDLDNIITFGARKQDPTTLHSICDAQIAQHVAQLLLQRTLYIRERYTFRLPWNFALVEPMDYLTLTTTTDELLLNRQVVRVIDITEDETSDELAFTAEGVDIGVASAALYAPHSGTGATVNSAVAPGSVSSPVLFNAPLALTPGDRQIWCAVGSTSPAWGGCEVWISVDNVDYQKIGTVNAPARYGVLTASLASHADPDTTNTLSVNLSTSLGALASATAAESDAGGTLSWIGGELAGYKDATLTGSHAYNLTTLHRGMMNTAPAAHSSGDAYVRLDDAIFKFSFLSLNAGATIYVKLPSFNLYGLALEDISTVTAFTVATNSTAPAAPGAGTWTATGGSLTSGSSSLPALIVTGASDNPNAEGIVIEYRVHGATDWISAGISPAKTIAINVTSIAAATSYDVAVSYRVNGVVGARLVLGPVTSGTAGAGSAADATTLGTLYHAADITTILSRLSAAGIP